jgi:serine/threonine protein kinase
LIIYLVIDVNTDEEVVIKLEHESIDPLLLREEVEVYKSLAGGAGIPTIYWFGRECEYRVMVFELLGPSLEDLFNYCGRQFSLKTVLMIAD